MVLTPASFWGLGHDGCMDLRRAVPILTVADIEATVAEYESLLGLDVLMNLGWIATLGTAAPGGGAGMPQFSVLTRDISAPVNPDLSLEVDDVDAAFARARAAGAEIVHPLRDEDWGVRRFFVRTHDGHVVNVLSHRE